MTIENCETCRYWSEMIAQSIDGRPVEALCLSRESPFRSLFTIANATCKAWRSNHHGAIDAPPNYGELARAAYAADGDYEE